MKSRGEETRRLVLRAAEEVFAKVGYAGARMEDIADRIGIRRASLVHYFRDKQELYEAMLDDLFGELLGRYEAVLAGPEPTRERLLRCIEVWATHVEARPSLLRISLWEMARATPPEPVPLTARVGPIVRKLAEAIAAGQREGVVRADVDPIAFVMSVAGTTTFLGRRMALLDPSGASPALEPGRLATELRTWATHLLFAD
jgi:TetR/AcrR family transcriptional regulator